MPTLYLIRHAKPAASWGQDPDPGLDPTGIAQAAATAHELIARVARRLPVLTSPLRRCRETAVPLEREWQTSAAIFPAVAEIPAPPLGLAERHEWLLAAMAGSWQNMQATAPPNSPDYHAWRSGLLQALTALRQDTVIYTHFIAINAVVGAARGLDEVVCFRPDHASTTIIDTDGEQLQIIATGREAATSVLTR